MDEATVKVHQSLLKRCSKTKKRGALISDLQCYMPFVNYIGENSITNMHGVPRKAARRKRKIQDREENQQKGNTKEEGL